MEMMRFAYAEKSQEKLIQSWLLQDYIQKWLHGKGLENTLQDLALFLNKKSSSFQHFIAYDGPTPFAYLLTSDVCKEKGSNDPLAQWSQLSGRTITLDVMICEPSYLGKGFAHTMIKTFLLNQFPDVDEVLIDPEKANQRAAHVYQKAGFQILGEFIAPWHPVPHYMMQLNMKSLLK